MPTLEQIQEQIKNLDGVSKLFGRKEILELPGILWEDEDVERLVQGLYNNGNGVLVGTNKRLIFIDKGVFKLKVEDFPYDKISSIQYETGMVFGKITIFTSGNRAEIKQIEKSQARKFAEGVRARISVPQKNVNSLKEVAVTVDDDVVSKLERLAKLKNDGIISEEEFRTQKSRLLS